MAAVTSVLIDAKSAGSLRRLSVAPPALVTTPARYRRSPYPRARRVHEGM
jgi:hypothetical protein